LPACSAVLCAAVGWEAARLCVSREAKPAKIDSLMEKIFCARHLKEKEIFAGFACHRQAASRWGGMPSRPSAEASPLRPETSRAEPSRNFPFLFKIFRGVRKKNCKGKFMRGCRRSVSGGGRRGGEHKI